MRCRRSRPVPRAPPVPIADCARLCRESLHRQASPSARRRRSGNRVPARSAFAAPSQPNAGRRLRRVLLASSLRSSRVNSRVVPLRNRPRRRQSRCCRSPSSSRSTTVDGICLYLRLLIGTANRLDVCQLRAVQSAQARWSTSSASAGVGIRFGGRPRGDQIERIAQHVGDDQRDRVDRRDRPVPTHRLSRRLSWLRTVLSCPMFAPAALSRRVPREFCRRA